MDKPSYQDELIEARIRDPRVGIIRLFSTTDAYGLLDSADASVQYTQLLASMSYACARVLPSGHGWEWILYRASLGPEHLLALVGMHYNVYSNIEPDLFDYVEVSPENPSQYARQLLHLGVQAGLNDTFYALLACQRGLDWYPQEILDDLSDLGSYVPIAHALQARHRTTRCTGRKFALEVAECARVLTPDEPNPSHRLACASLAATWTGSALELRATTDGICAGTPRYAGG